MGKEISKIAYNEEYIDLRVVGLSKTQVGMIKQHFNSLASKTRDGELRFGAKNIASLLGVPAKEAQLIVDFADLDGDGCLSDYEFVCLVGLFTQGALEDKLIALFSLFDSDFSQLINEEEMVQLVRCVLSINENGKDPAPGQVQDKIAEIKCLLFSKETEIRLADFIVFAQEDEDFKMALHKIGVISEKELQSEFNNDLECEMNKLGGDDLRADDEEFMKKKLGVTGEDDEGGMFVNDHVGEGDQFMAVKPFLGVVKNSVPSDFDPKKYDPSNPNVSLDLEYVHGYRCFDTRNNIRWISPNNILFHTAGVSVSMNCETNRQKFNFDNTDDIIAMDKFSNICATGQIGHKPFINIFNCETMETMCLVNGHLEKGISQLAFNSTGNFLAGCAMNDDHDLAVYDVSNPHVPKLFANAKGVKDVVLDMKFMQGQPTVQCLILATQRGLYTADVAKGSIKVSKVSGWGAKGAPTCLCIGFTKNWDYVVGLQSGELAAAKGKAIGKIIPAHKGPLFAICSDNNKQQLFTGGAGGDIIIWDAKLDQKMVIDLFKENLSISSPKVRALCFDDKTGKLLVGTRSGEIAEITPGQANKGKVHLKGHFDRELWGLSVHPSNDEYITCGEDFLLAKWNMSTRKQVSNYMLKFQAKTTDICPKGKSIAVGCTNGTVIIFDYATLKEIKSIKPSSKEISIVRYSPDGSQLAVGAHDARIYMFNVSKGYPLENSRICKGHHSTITHLDFSKNSKVLMSNCTSYEILFWDVDSCRQDTRGASNNKNEEWASWTCTLGWPVQGVFPPCTDGTDVNSVDRCKEGGLIATGDDFGKVNLFRYPCLKGSANLKFVGHSSHVTCVKFSANSKYLISIGGNDKSIFQWKVEMDNAGDNAEYQEDTEIDAQEFVPSNFRHGEDEKNKKPVEETNGMFELAEDEEGDQFMAVKPWVGDLKKSIPSDYVYQKGMEDAPEETLEVHYVNGYRCFDARNTAAFGTTKGSVVFASAALGVELNVASNTQTFFNKHEEDIVSFAMHPNREIVATGQMAMKGKAKLIDIFVWKVGDKEVLANLKGFHLRAIQLLKFSPSGNKLLSFGQDDDNSLAVYDWAKGVLLTTSKVDKTNVLECIFLSETQFITSGTKHLKFWSMAGANVSGKNASWSALKNKSEAVVALAPLENGMAVGGSWSGAILMLSGGSVASATPAHQGPVYVLHYNKEQKKLYSGGKDGAIHEFQVDGSRIKLLRTIFKLSATESMCPSIRVIDTLKDCMLIGTMASELFTFDNFTSSAGGKKQLLLSGHFKGELWGLACHPTLPQYATCGDDESLRVWNAAQRKMIVCQNVKTKLRAVEYSPDGKFIITASMEGKVFLYDSELKKEIQNMQTSFKGTNQWIEDIKFSPNGNYVAFGAHGGASKVEVLTFDGKVLKPYGTINAGLTSALLHLDWSEDSNFLVVNSQAYELKFVDINSKKQIAASAMKDTDWATWTCKLGFPVQGIFPAVDGTDVNTVCRASNRKVLATGDDFQLVKLFKYPSVMPKSGFRSYVAHASHVTRVRFMLKDSVLVSTGGNDKVNIIWTTSFGLDNTITSQKGATNESTEDDFGEYTVHKKLDKDKYGKGKETQVQVMAEEANEDNGNPFAEEVVDEGTEFMAVKPWLGAIKPPSNFLANPSLDSPPEIDVTLEYAHGYRSKDCRNNIFWRNGLIYYHTAAIAVCLDKGPNEQIFFNGHRDDIISMAYSQTSDVFATAEIGPKPRIYLWKPEGMTELSLLKGGAIKGVCSLAFSPSGRRLVGTCIDDNHHVVLYNTETFEMIACEKGDTANILDCEWITETEFVTVGLRHYKLWKTGNGIVGSRGSFGKNNDKLVCAKKFKSSVLCGTVDGELQVWGGSACSKSSKIHTGSLDAIAISPSEKIITGGKDRRISIQDANLTFIYAINLSEVLIDGQLNQVRSLCFNDTETELYVGTFASEIYCLSTSGAKFSTKLENSEISVQQVMSGHFARNDKWTNEVWGLSTIDEDRYLTVSDDGTLRMWSTSERKMLKSMKLNIDAKGCQLPPDKATGDLAEAAKLRSVGVCMEGKHAAVGCKEGTLRIIDIDSWKQIHLIKKRKEWISEIRYSPDNEFLAVGSHDNYIDIYNVKLKYKFVFGMRKHSSFITHLDWSEDSNYLHSTCGAYELLFWNAKTGTQLTSGASALRDEQWATWSCVLGWPVQGIFQPEWDGSDINMVDRSHKELRKGYKILATADDFSNLRIYRYPCLRKTAKSVILYGHSSHVTNVKFNASDEYIYSTGGEDHTIMQWKVTPK
jgi:WD40 repeat protein/Ca2+-binding EF-hand superfamily protein